MNFRRSRVVVASLFVLGAVALPMSWAAAADEDISQKVQSAKSASDHEAIAKLYDAQAADARKKAAEHKRMGDSYRGTSVGKAGASSSMSYHCDALVKSFELQAVEFEAMAEAQRQLAKLAK